MDHLIESQSLCFQGILLTGVDAGLELEWGVSIPLFSGHFADQITEADKAGKETSQSLCFQGILLTIIAMVSSKYILSQSLCFQGILLTPPSSTSWVLTCLNPFVFRAFC